MFPGAWSLLEYIQDIVGQGTAPDQLQAVENFITQKVDALVVVQNSPKTTSECLKLAKAAGIPEFHLTHNPPNEPGLTGVAGYDWVTLGQIAGRSAIAHKVSRVIMIEGKLGQGTAGGQTMGFLQSYKAAGKDIGNLLQSVGVKGAGGKDLKVVFWATGGWFADPAKKAMQEAGIDPSKYWLGSSNGKEKSWKWVANGQVTMDCNETPTLEADICYQQIKACFAGKPFKKAVFVSFIPYDKANLDTAKLVPYLHDDYFKKRDAKAFKFDINDPQFKANPEYK